MGTETQTINCNFNIVNRIDFTLIEDELGNFLRNNLTDRRSRSLYNTETFTADGELTTFELTGDKDSAGRHKIMNVKKLTVDGVEQTFIKDYIIGFRKDSPILGKIQFWNPPSDGSIIKIYYYYKYSFVFTESTRVDLTTNSYPRVSLQIFQGDPKDRCVGGKVTSHTFTIYLTVVDIQKTYVTNIMQEINNLFVEESNKHGFQSFDYIRNPKFTALLPNGEDPNDVVFVQQAQLEIPNQYQFSK